MDIESCYRYGGGRQQGWSLQLPRGPREACKCHEAKDFSPVPSTLTFQSLLFLAQKKRRIPQKKARIFLSLPNPRNPWKRREKRTKKQGKPENEKSKENGKSKDWKVRVVDPGLRSDHGFLRKVTRSISGWFVAIRCAIGIATLSLARII